MRASSRAYELIRDHEGLRLSAYQCSAGVWTIGYGHTGDVIPQGKISIDIADRLLISDVQKFESALNLNLASKSVELSQNQFDACISLMYNIGIKAFLSSSVWKNILLDDFKKASESFLLWNKARVNGELQELSGLTKRRQAEKEVFDLME